MSKAEKLIIEVLSGRKDASFRFEEIVGLLYALGFSERTKGDHHIFYKKGIEELINLQPKDGMAKAYQVRQIRQLILKYRMEA